MICRSKQTAFRNCYSGKEINMNSKQLRKKAWNALKGRYWWTVLAALIASVFGVLSFGTSSGAAGHVQDVGEKTEQIFIDLPDNGKIAIFIVVAAIIIIGIGMTILGFAVKLGYRRFNMDLFTGVEKPTMNLLFSRTNIVWKSLWMDILRGILITIGSILFIVPGIIVGLMYSQSEYILAENPELKATEAMKKSRELMKGNKWALFKLDLSFIGWIILSGIVPAGPLFLAPYTEAADAAFYLDRTGRLNEEAKDLGELESKA